MNSANINLRLQSEEKNAESEVALALTFSHDYINLRLQWEDASTPDTRALALTYSRDNLTNNISGLKSVTIHSLISGLKSGVNPTMKKSLSSVLKSLSFGEGFRVRILLKGILLTFLFLAFSHSSFSQTKEELQKKKESLLKEIDAMQKDLDKTKKSKTASLTEVKALQKKISTREKLIGNYNSQIGQLDNQITETRSGIKTLDNNLGRLKKNYAAMVYTAYKHRSTYSRLLFVLSATSFNDAVKRILYLRRYSAYRRSQSEVIVKTKTTLTGKVKVLSNQKKDKRDLLTEQQKEKDKLQKEKTTKDKVVKQLSGQEKKIKADLAVKKKEQDALNKKIADIIKKEIAAANKTTTVTNKDGTKTTTTTNFAKTPEGIALSTSFITNQGKFPWPVSEGSIIESFGTHPHPVLKNVTTKNNGCDISTTTGANVRAIFKGTVVSVLQNPGYHTAVIIRHGEYFTVYSNLSSVSVKANDNVETKQSIGKAYTDPQEGAMVHLEIWKGTSLLDPENWLAPR